MSVQAQADAETAVRRLQDGDPGALELLSRAIASGDRRLGTRLNLAIAIGTPAALSDLAAEHPGWDEPVLHLAQCLRDAGDWRSAEAAYRRVLVIDPHRPEALTALGARLAITAPAEGRVLLARACAAPDARWEAWHALGAACLADNDPGEAIAALDAALLLAPDRLDVLLLRGEAAAADARVAAEFERLDASDPLAPNTMIARAALLEHTGQRASAIGELEALVAMAPDHAPALTALGGLLARADRAGEAEPVLRHAISIDPAQQARLDLSTVLMKRQAHHEARELIDGLLAERGDDTTLLCNKAQTLCSLGDQEEAVKIAERACAIDPAAFAPWRALANVLPYSPAMTSARLLAVVSQVAACLPRGPTLTRRTTGRLRLGLLSGSLRTHPVGWLTVAGFEHLDRARFEIVRLSPPAAPDALARRFAAASSGHIDTSRLEDKELAAAAREAGIDIVIDLGGYGDTGRMAACARRLAPVQIKWVGMQNSSTGLPEIDWFVTDRWETPPELAPLYTERLLRMPDGYVCYSPPAYAPDVAPAPCLRNGHVTFGCFNNLAKITPVVIETWAEILRRVETGRLIIKCHQLGERSTADRIQLAFGQHGIASGRVELRGASPHRQLLAQYADVDIVLDPFPYGGGLTTCEALWMGVPTVTLPGEIFAARHSLSHLSNAGLPGWAAADREDYVRIACARASDPQAGATLRAGLRQQVKASPLCDAPRFGRHLGQALVRAWEET